MTTGWRQQANSKLAFRHTLNSLFSYLCLGLTWLGVVVLVILLASVAKQGVGYLNLNFLSSFPSRFPDQAGIKAALFGTLWLIAMTALFAIPVGVGAAVYLEEYSERGPVSTFIEVNISNLAGVPSIVYGMLGLILFVRGKIGVVLSLIAGLGLLVSLVALALSALLKSETLIKYRSEMSTGALVSTFMGLLSLVNWTLDRSIVSGALTMSLLILPVIITASREALRAVPNSLRLAAFGLGATRWQVVRHHVLPAAIPGILTGVILSLSRAIGETAPLIMIGALTFVAYVPEGPMDDFTVLPIQIYNWASRPEHEFHALAAAAILVLLVVLLVMNALAVFIRWKFERKLT